MRVRSVPALLGVLVALLVARPAAAQRGPTPTPLEGFIREVAYLWSGNDVRALEALMPDGAEILLDTGDGMEAVQPRHAAAALRALFSGRQSVSARPVRATFAGGRPPQGFGELTWSFRSRGSPTAQTGSVYVGVVWGDAGWRITELRVMR